jgi:hypothetical protein
LLVLAGGGSAAANGLAPLLPDGVASASREIRETWCERAKAWAMTLATARDEGLPREKAEETVAAAAAASAPPVIRSVASFAYRHRELEWDVVTVLVSSVCVERHLKGSVIAERQLAAIVAAFEACQTRYGVGEERYVCLTDAMRRALGRR